jgi:hypothetical protein
MPKYIKPTFSANSIGLGFRKRKGKKRPEPIALAKTGAFLFPRS